MSEFKVGDWVREDFGDMNIVKIKEKYIAEDGSVYINNFNSELFSHWQPKNDEWCWFKDEKNTIGSLTQLVGIEKDGTYYGYSSYGMPDKAPCVEPFIGELPSFLKDNA